MGRTLRLAQPCTREPHDESPTHAEDVRGTSAAKPALVFIKCIVEPEGFEPPAVRASRGTTGISFPPHPHMSCPLKAGSTYSVWVGGADGGSGAGLVEIYELP